MERFMAGETTNAEEKALIGFFNGPSVPADMERYRYMMMFYDRGLQLPNESPSTKKRPFFRPWQWVSIAATIVLLCTVTFSFMKTRQKYAPDEYAIYEGSYIVRNGEKITDIEKIMPEIQKAEVYIDTVGQGATLDFSIPDEDLMYIDASEALDMDDPDTKAAFIEATSNDK